MFIFSFFFLICWDLSWFAKRTNIHKEVVKKQIYKKLYNEKMDSLELCLARNFTPMCGFFKQVPNTQYETV